MHLLIYYISSDISFVYGYRTYYAPFCLKPGVLPSDIAYLIVWKYFLSLRVNLRFSMQSAMHLQHVYPVYIHKVPVILHYNLHSESHNPYVPPPTVT